MKKIFCCAIALLFIAFNLSAQNRFDITIYRGDYRQVTMPQITSNHAVRNLFFTVKKDFGITSSRLIEKTSPVGITATYNTITNRTAINIAVSRSDTWDLNAGTYYWDLESQSASDTNDVTTLLKGNFIVNADVRTPFDATDLPADARRYLPVFADQFDNGEWIKKSGTSFVGDSLLSFMRNANNLSDLPDKVTARTNLGVYSTTTVDQFFFEKLDSTLASTLLRSQWSTAYAHSLLANNPHSVTTEQLTGTTLHLGGGNPALTIQSTSGNALLRFIGPLQDYIMGYRSDGKFVIASNDGLSSNTNFTLNHVSGLTSLYSLEVLNGGLTLGGNLSATNNQLFIIANDSPGNYQSYYLHQKDGISKAAWRYDSVNELLQICVPWNNPLMSFDSFGNMGFGTASFGTNAAKIITIGNGVAPTSSIADGVQLYAEDVATSSELKVRDEAGNITTLSPHNVEFLNSLTYDDDFGMRWAYTSVNPFLGKKINVDLFGFIRDYEIRFGKQFIFIEDLPDSMTEDWDENQTHIYRDREKEIGKWENKKNKYEKEIADYDLLSDDEKRKKEKPIFDEKRPTQYIPKDAPAYIKPYLNLKKKRT